MCLGGEGAVLKTVGPKGLAGSNPVHGAIYNLSACGGTRRDTQDLKSCTTDTMRVQIPPRRPENTCDHMKRSVVPRHVLSPLKTVQQFFI